jgi:hypothetical protein
MERAGLSNVFNTEKGLAIKRPIRSMMRAEQHCINARG